MFMTSRLGHSLSAHIYIADINSHGAASVYTYAQLGSSLFIDMVYSVQSFYKWTAMTLMSDDVTATWKNRCCEFVFLPESDSADLGRTFVICI